MVESGQHPNPKPSTPDHLAAWIASERAHDAGPHASPGGFAASRQLQRYFAISKEPKVHHAK